ncbi:hypothetical protein GCK32_003800 [Trichostrongylus colubriformis]|uniref:Core domain-containing protein n=1 Tax=Trichostrongylus colubriformis TaxID=6319 RepID=A0AAN8ISU3_TRICO
MLRSVRAALHGGSRFSRSFCISASDLKPLTTEDIKVTDKAHQRLKEVLAPGERLRVEVDGGGCSGFEYKLKLDSKLQKDDRLWRGDNVEVVIDELSLGYLRGATIDFVEDLMKASFRVITYRDETRLREAEEYMDEVMKICYQIYGASSYHTINMLNNFGAALIIRNRFELAVKYLAIGIERILYVNECANMMPGYYCNYAEALFHVGRKDEALEWARKAVLVSKSEEPRIQSYAQKFLRDLEKDAKGKSSRSWWLLW